MSDVLDKPATYEDVLAAPPNMVAEIIHASLVTHPRPAPKHLLAACSLCGELGGPFHKGDGGPGGWWILIEPELHLGSEIVVPDLAGWRRERMPKLPETAWFPLAPDWVCEMVSPATARYDRVEKRDIYGAHSVAHLWFVDPDARTLEAFSREGGHGALVESFAESQEVAAPPFEAVPFSLSALWAE